MRLNNRRRINLEFLQTLKGCVALFKDPTDAYSVFDIEDGMRHSKAMQLAVEYLKSQPEVAQIIEERYIAPTPDIDALLAYPQDSLGYVFAAYIQQAGFDPGFYRQLPVEDDVSYVLLRMRQTHDIWHVVTDFSPTVVGEIGLKAFELAQTRRTQAGILVAGAVLNFLLKTPEQLDQLLDRIAVGYRMGSKAKPFLAQKWEEHWDKPLSEWRSDLGVEPMPVYVP